MKVTFLGVGEACDERFPNTAVHIGTKVYGEAKSVLLDCGFTVPPLYWRQTGDPEDLDVLWISHFHGDHFFGSPALLLRFWEQNRRKPLLVLGQAGIEDLVHQSLDLAYPTIRQKLGFPLEFIRVEPGEPVKAAGLTWNFAESGHSRRNLSVRVEDGEKALFYSGDGLPSSGTVSLAHGTDLIIHESFRFDQPMAAHGSMKQCVDFAREARVGKLALVHFQRDERREKYGAIVEYAEKIQDLRVIIPEPGDELDL